MKKLTSSYAKLIFICFFSFNNFLLRAQAPNPGCGSNNIITVVNVTNTTISISATILYLYPNSSDVILTICTNSSFTTGCQAICMKHQTDENSDSNLKFYNDKFNSNYGDKNNFSWILKEQVLRREPAENL
jgi:hypothetical protein